MTAIHILLQLWTENIRAYSLGTYQKVFADVDVTAADCYTAATFDNLIQRGGGTGPTKPRQPDADHTIRTAGANSGRRGLADEEAPVPLLTIWRGFLLVFVYDEVCL